MMRIIAGKYRGRKIETINDKKLRPTMGVAREALFNILSHGRFADEENRFLDGCRVLDLFCGCGALALEALSRGAAHVTLMDIDSEHLQIARQNIKKIGEENHATFIRGDSSKPPMARATCNLVFIDPPYNEKLAHSAMEKLVEGKWLEKGAIVVVETGKTEDLPEVPGYTEFLNRNYGNSRIRMFEWGV
jgi:16S rRNA (guanine966-N2)-methyltransferase